ncbi:hypothetical protein H4219_002272, partial [Mycoemilia scoparia]
MSNTKDDSYPIPKEDEDEEFDDVEYEVKSIIGKRVSSSAGIEYFIVWLGYPISDSTWESEENLNCPKAVLNFEVQVQYERREGKANTHFERQGLVVLLEEAREFFDNLNVFEQDEQDHEKDQPQQQTLDAFRMINTHDSKVVRILDSIKDINGTKYYRVLWKNGKECWVPARILPIALPLLQAYEHSCFKKERQEIAKAQQKLDPQVSTQTEKFKGLTINSSDEEDSLDIDTSKSAMPLPIPKSVNGLLLDSSEEGETKVDKKPNGKTSRKNPAKMTQPVDLLSSEISQDSKENLSTYTDLNSSSEDKPEETSKVESNTLSKSGSLKRNRRIVEDSSSDETVEEEVLSSNKSVAVQNKKRARCSSSTPPISSDASLGDAVDSFMDVMSDSEEAPTMDLLGTYDEENVNGQNCDICRQAKVDITAIDRSLLFEKGSEGNLLNPKAVDRQRGFIRSCLACEMACHPVCFRQNLTKPLAKEELSEPLKIESTDWETLYKQTGIWLCIYCSLWKDFQVSTILTSRPEEGVEDSNDWSSVGTFKDSAASKKAPKYDIEIFNKHQFLVKFEGRSYRHLAWVPFIWLKQSRVSLIRSYLRRLRGHAPLTRNLVVNSSWTLPERIYDAQLLPNSIVSTRKSEFKTKINAARLKWDEDHKKPGDVQHEKNNKSDEPVSPSKLRKINSNSPQGVKDVNLEAYTNPYIDLDPELYTNVQNVFVKWAALEMDQSTWDTVPSPFDEPISYKKWSDLFMVWKDKCSVSVNEMKEYSKSLSSAERKRNSVFCEFKNKPWFIGDGQPKLKLFDHQLEGLNFLSYKRSQNLSCILADDMGLGKTIQTIAFIATVFCSSIPTDALKGKNSKKTALTTCNKGTGPFLVVVPNSIVTNWLREFEMWAPFLIAEPYFGGASSRALYEKYAIFGQCDGGIAKSSKKSRRSMAAHVLVCTYDVFVNDDSFNTIKSINAEWEYLVVDEGHRLKNDRAKLFKNLNKLKINKRVLLTGTPLQNNVRELLTLMSFVDPIKFGDIDGLEEKYGNIEEANISELHDLLRPYFLRRTKEQVLSKLPPKHEIFVPISMTSIQRQLYRAALGKNVELLKSIYATIHNKDRKAENGSKSATAKKHHYMLNNMLMEIRKIINHPYMIDGAEPAFNTLQETHDQLVKAGGKTKFLKGLLKQLKEKGHRVLLFSQMKRSLDILEDVLFGEGYGYVRMDGDTSSIVRQNMVDKFNEPESKLFAFLSTTRAGGLGLNLTSADVVIIYDPDWNPHMDIQALSRAYRIGQTKPVMVFKLMTQDSAEEKMVKVGARKMVLDHLIIESLRNQKDSDEDEVDNKDIEQALRFGAEFLFGENAEERAASREIEYDDKRISALLDECKNSLAEAAKRKEEENNSDNKTGGDKDSAKKKGFGYGRVWEYEKEDIILQDSEVSTPAVDASEESNYGGFWDKLFKDNAANNSSDDVKKAQQEYGRGHRKRAQDICYSEKKAFESTPKKPKSKKTETGENEDKKDSDYVPISDNEADDLKLDLELEQLTYQTETGPPILTATQPQSIQNTMPHQTTAMIPDRQQSINVQKSAVAQHPPSLPVHPPRVNRNTQLVPQQTPASQIQNPQAFMQQDEIFYKDILFKFKKTICQLLRQPYAPLREPENVLRQDFSEIHRNSQEYLTRGMLSENKPCPICDKARHSDKYCNSILHPTFPVLLKSIFAHAGCRESVIIKALLIWYKLHFSLFHIHQSQSRAQPMNNNNSPIQTSEGIILSGSNTSVLQRPGSSPTANYNFSAQPRPAPMSSQPTTRPVQVLYQQSTGANIPAKQGVSTAAPGFSSFRVQATGPPQVVTRPPMLPSDSQRKPNFSPVQNIQSKPSLPTALPNPSIQGPNPPRPQQGGVGAVNSSSMSAQTINVNKEPTVSRPMQASNPPSSQQAVGTVAAGIMAPQATLANKQPFGNTAINASNTPRPPKGASTATTSSMNPQATLAKKDPVASAPMQAPNTHRSQQGVSTVATSVIGAQGAIVRTEPIVSSQLKKATATSLPVTSNRPQVKPSQPSVSSTHTPVSKPPEAEKPPISRAMTLEQRRLQALRLTQQWYNKDGSGTNSDKNTKPASPSRTPTPTTATTSTATGAVTGNAAPKSTASTLVLPRSIQGSKSAQVAPQRPSLPPPAAQPPVESHAKKALEQNLAQKSAPNNVAVSASPSSSQYAQSQVNVQPRSVSQPHTSNNTKNQQRQSIPSQQQQQPQRQPTSSNCTTTAATAITTTAAAPKPTPATERKYTAEEWLKLMVEETLESNRINSPAGSQAGQINQAFLNSVVPGQSTQQQQQQTLQISTTAIQPISVTPTQYGTSPVQGFTSTSHNGQIDPRYQQRLPSGNVYYDNVNNVYYVSQSNGQVIAHYPQSYYDTPPVSQTGVVISRNHQAFRSASPMTSLQENINRSGFSHPSQITEIDNQIIPSNIHTSSRSQTPVSMSRMISPQNVVASNVDIHSIPSPSPSASSLHSVISQQQVVSSNVSNPGGALQPFNNNNNHLPKNYDMVCPLCFKETHDPDQCTHRFNLTKLQRQYEYMLLLGIPPITKNVLLRAVKSYIDEARQAHYNIGQ